MVDLGRSLLHLLDGAGESLEVLPAPDRDQAFQGDRRPLDPPEPDELAEVIRLDLAGLGKGRHGNVPDPPFPFG